MHLDRNRLEVLSRDEALRLVSTAAIGRVLVTDGALPSAFPVNFALLGDDVVFRTGAGSKLKAAVTNTVVGFEVDEFDRRNHSGWSVLITGHSTEITDAAQLALANRLPLQSWLPDVGEHVIRVTAQIVTGRRLGLESRAASPGVTEMPYRSPWSGPAVESCRACGDDRLVPVTDGEQTNFICVGCAACWHVEQGWMYRVDPATCPGCAYQAECSHAYIADGLRRKGATR